MTEADFDSFVAILTLVRDLKVVSGWFGVWEKQPIHNLLAGSARGSQRLHHRPIQALLAKLEVKPPIFPVVKLDK
jgi:hypothetical protein